MGELVIPRYVIPPFFRILGDMDLWLGFWLFFVSVFLSSFAEVITTCGGYVGGHMRGKATVFYISYYE